MNQNQPTPARQAAEKIAKWFWEASQEQIFSQRKIEEILTPYFPPPSAQSRETAEQVMHSVVWTQHEESLHEHFISLEDKRHLQAQIAAAIDAAREQALEEINQARGIELSELDLEDLAETKEFERMLDAGDISR